MEKNFDSLVDIYSTEEEDRQPDILAARWRKRLTVRQLTDGGEE